MWENPLRASHANPFPNSACGLVLLPRHLHIRYVPSFIAIRAVVSDILLSVVSQWVLPLKIEIIISYYCKGFSFYKILFYNFNEYLNMVRLIFV